MTTPRSPQKTTALRELPTPRESFSDLVEMAAALVPISPSRTLELVVEVLQVLLGILLLPPLLLVAAACFTIAACMGTIALGALGLFLHSLWAPLGSKLLVHLQVLLAGGGDALLPFLTSYLFWVLPGFLLVHGLAPQLGDPDRSSPISRATQVAGGWTLASWLLVLCLDHTSPVVDLVGAFLLPLVGVLSFGMVLGWSLALDLAPLSLPASAPRAEPLPEGTVLVLTHHAEEVTCEYCGDPLPAQGAVACTHCHGPLHRDCWEEAGRCVTYACPGHEVLPVELPPAA